MIAFITIILSITILIESFIENRHYRELKNRIFELEMKNTELKLLMSNILDIFSGNGQPRTESEHTDLPGNEKPKNTPNTDPQKGSDNR